MQVNVHEAKMTLSKLLRRAEAGEEIIIARGGKAVAKFVRYERAPSSCLLGRDAALVYMAEDLDAPLPDNLLDQFER